MNVTTSNKFNPPFPVRCFVRFVPVHHVRHRVFCQTWHKVLRQKSGPVVPCVVPPALFLCGSGFFPLPSFVLVSLEESFIAAYRRKTPVARRIRGHTFGHTFIDY